MSLPVIQAHTCSTCRYKERLPDPGRMLCRRMPPSITPILAMTPDGPQPTGFVTNFPIVNSSDWCWEHPSLVRPAAPQILS